VKNPGNGRLNNLNDPVLNVLMLKICTMNHKASLNVAYKGAIMDRKK